MADYVIIPKADWQAALDATRARTGKQELILSDQLAGEIESISGGGGSAEGVHYVTFMNHDGTVEAGKLPVAEGYDCPVPKFDAPVKESDVQYDYTFVGWATTPDGELDENALANVTEDRVVYAAYASSVRVYTITFYDSDGTTVLTTQQVAYGSVPSYLAEKDGYKLIGWTPSLTAVTGDASYTAKWEELTALQAMSWAEIAEIAESGQAAEYFNLGDERTATIGSKEYTVRIIGFNHDDKTDGSGKAGITFVCKNYGSLTTGNNYSTTTTSWGNSKRYSSYASAYSSMESELKSVVKQVRKTYKAANGTETTVDCFAWALSATELGFTSSGVQTEGARYECFSANKSEKNAYTDLTKNCGSNFYLRSMFMGGLAYISSQKLYYVSNKSYAYDAPCFCI